MYEPGSPSSAFTTITLSGSAARAALHFVPAGKPAPPRPRTLASLTCSSSSSGDGEPSAWRSLERATAQQHRLVEHALALRLLGLHSAGQQAVDHVRPGVHDVALAHGGRRVAKPGTPSRPARPTRPPARSPSPSPRPCSTCTTCSPKSDAQQAIPVHTITCRSPRGWTRSS